MNALFFINESLMDYGGISKKILAQVDALKRQGMKVELSYLKVDDTNNFTGRYVDEKVIDKFSHISLISKVQRRCNYKNLYQYIEANDIKLVYIRYIHFANSFFISFLKKLKRSGVTVLLELPTYPYDQEYQNALLPSKIAFLIERSCRKKFQKYVDRIITLSNDNCILETPTIKINNGIDGNSINIVQKRKPDNEIHIIAVATISYWHGYDRVIEGLHYYYTSNAPNRRKVFFYIVGDGADAESARYRKLVEKYNLAAYVNFYGRRSGKELDHLFNESDIAVGCLGCHRKGMNYSKSLKNREYCARGIPFFYSETDQDFEGKDFIFKVAPNDDPIDINKIIKFVENNKFDAVKIRNYAVENLTWDMQFKKIVGEVFPDFEKSIINPVEY